MNTIIINYNMFSKYVRFYIVENDESYSKTIPADISILTSNIVTEANKHNAYHVKIDALSPIIDEIREQVKQYEIMKYSKNKILIEEI